MGKGVRVFLAAVWLSAAGVGFGALWSYELTSSGPITAPVQWPEEAKLLRASNLPIVLMFAHPECPCTRASLRELEILMTQCQGKVKAQVVFFRPENATDDWAKTDLWESAVAIPGVTAAFDVGGGEARRFHATTSGQVYLYDVTGCLRFAGGITASRGHSGDNAGRAAIVSILHGEIPNTYSTFAYGCSISAPTCQLGEGEAPCHEGMVSCEK